MNDSLTGLSAADVDERRRLGRTNDVVDPTSRSLAQIVRANVITPFNILLGVLLIVVIAIREWADALFGVVLVFNASIGIVQETRSKRTLDRLAVLNAPRSTVRREGVDLTVDSAELVLDDVIVLALGDQVVVDGVVLDASGLEIDESLLTGEADPVDKAIGDRLMSGSFVVAGSGIMRATEVGADAYAFRLSSEARRFSLVRSELRSGIDSVIKIVGWLMLPTSVLLVTSQLTSQDGLIDAIQGSVAGLVAMVPEGLVLLTSIAFALGATRLARKRVLTQEMAAIEGLARVDVLCIDKTGTLTEGALSLATVEYVAEQQASRVDAGDVLAALGAADDHPNPSLLAITAEYPAPPQWNCVESIPFSSARKWSAARFADHGAWFLGAPDILLERVGVPADAERTRLRLEHHSRSGRRVLLLAHSPEGLTGDELPGRLEPLALVVLDERLRPAAPRTIEYFAEQGVTVKVISGDSPLTVSAVATRVGVIGAEEPVDARTLPEDPDALAEVLETHSVFGRVTPHQKRAMVHALQSRGHTVAMTGDGVNDTLALKDADVGVAMGSGSAAARAVARFVLLDNDFAVFPSVVNEGRRVIANIERVSNLFLSKTFYAALLALAVGIGRIPFPFLPRHYTVISSLTIGIPGFFLALAPNARRAVAGFLRRVLRFTIPAGIAAGSCTLISYLFARTETDLASARSAAVITLFVIGLWILEMLCRPMNLLKAGLVIAMTLAFIGALSIGWFRTYFEIPIPDRSLVVSALGFGSLGAALVELAQRVRLPVVDAR